VEVGEKLDGDGRRARRVGCNFCPLLVSTVNLTNMATESYKKRNSNHHNRMRINKTAFQSNADNSQTHFWSCHLDHDPMTLLEATNLPRRF